MKGQTVNTIRGIEESSDEEMEEEGQQHDETNQSEVSVYACSLCLAHPIILL